MISLRMLGRVAPKAPFRPAVARCYSAVSRSYRPSWQTVTKTSYPAFSTSVARKEPAGDSDTLLAEKLKSEYSLEMESKNEQQIENEQAIEMFKANSPWEIVEKDSTNEIVLTRSFGNETIKVECSIGDLDEVSEEMDEDYDMDQDTALGDEDYQAPKRTINQSGVKGGPIDAVAEDSIAPSDREDGSFPLAFPVHLDITISKPNDQSIEMRAVAHAGVVTIESLQYLESHTTKPGEEDLIPYGGPAFENLDPELQQLFEPYLEERGINTEFAQILPALLEVKEQKEYVGWLNGLKNFIET